MPDSHSCHCSICIELDHKESKRVLAPESQRSIGSPGHQQGAINTTKYSPQNMRRGRVSRICWAFNFLSCPGPLERVYWHTCLRLRKAPHRVSDCPEPPPQGDEDTAAPPSKTARMSKPGSSRGLQ